jgi:hypothetical protein
MFTQMEITEYVEEMRRAEECTDDVFSRHWGQMRERQLDQPRESWTRVAKWYREYEEATGTMLGCD